MRFVSDKHVSRLPPEYFGLARRKEAIGKLGVKPKLEFLTGLGVQGFLSSHVKWAIPAMCLYGKKRNVFCI